MKFEVVASDVVVIGAGGAGMRAAIAAAEAGAKVVLLTKGQAARSGAHGLPFLSSGFCHGGR